MIFIVPALPPNNYIYSIFVDIPDNLDSESAFESEFRYAVDLVRFIREAFGDYFTICVSGMHSKYTDT